MPNPALEPEDLAPYEIVNLDGKAPVLVTCDHARNLIPAEFDGLGIDPFYLENHIAYDIGARGVALELGELLDAPVLLANFSRLVVDLNRHLDDPTLIAEQSDGIDIPGNANLDTAARAHRIDRYFHTYHDRYSELVDTMQSRHRQPIILAVHSFTPTFGGFERPWEIGILWDRSRHLAMDLIQVLTRNTGFQIGDNQPYDANDPKGYAQVAHGHERGIEFALIEIRQDLVVDPDGQNRMARIMHEAVSEILHHHSSS